MTSIILYSSNMKIRYISKIIQEKIESDIIEIKDLNRKSGFFGNIKNNYNALRSKDTLIEPENVDLNDYDLILLGSPSTFGSISPAISTFIEKNSFENKNVIIFTTTNSHSGIDVLKSMKEKLQKKNANIINTFIMRTNNKTNKELRINTIKVIKDLDIDLYS